MGVAAQQHPEKEVHSPPLAEVVILSHCFIYPIGVSKKNPLFCHVFTCMYPISSVTTHPVMYVRLFPLLAILWWPSTLLFMLISTVVNSVGQQSIKPCVHCWGVGRNTVGQQLKHLFAQQKWAICGLPVCCWQAASFSPSCCSQWRWTWLFTISMATTGPPFF